MIGSDGQDKVWLAKEYQNLLQEKNLQLAKVNEARRETARANIILDNIAPRMAEIEKLYPDIPKLVEDARIIAALNRSRNDVGLLVSGSTASISNLNTTTNAPANTVFTGANSARLPTED